MGITVKSRRALRFWKYSPSAGEVAAVKPARFAHSTDRELAISRRRRTVSGRALSFATVLGVLIWPTMTDQEFWAEVRRKQAELDARYEAINQAWLTSEISCFVRETPDWQSGWKVLLDLLKPYDTRPLAEKSDPKNKYWPNSKTSWGQEVHIFSHTYNAAGYGHHHVQAALEEEFQRAILAWWKERAGTDGRPACDAAGAAAVLETPASAVPRRTPSRCHLSWSSPPDPGRDRRIAPQRNAGQ
jgi:hypothetical protein